MEKQNLQLLKLKIKDQCISQSSQNSSRSQGDNSTSSSYKGELIKRPNARIKQIQNSSSTETDSAIMKEEAMNPHELYHNSSPNIVKTTERVASNATVPESKEEQKSSSNSVSTCYTNEISAIENSNLHKPISMIVDKKIPCIIWSCQLCNVECIPVRRESRCLCGHRLKEHGRLSSSSNSSSSFSSSSSSSSSPFGCNTRGCDCSQFFFIVAEGAWILRCRCKHKHTDHDCSQSPYACKICKKNNNNNNNNNNNSSRINGNCTKTNNGSNKNKKTSVSTPATTTSSTSSSTNNSTSNSSSTSSSNNNNNNNPSSKVNGSSMNKNNSITGCQGFESPWICNCGHAWSLHTQQTVLKSLVEQGAQLEDVYYDTEQQSQKHQQASTQSSSGTTTNNKRSFAVRQDGLS